MSPDLVFILMLALRMAVSAIFVVTASIVTERSGPAIGALVATLPISAGPAYVFLALDHDAAFIAEGAVASLAINAATLFLSLTYVVLAQRHSAAISIAGAMAVWILLAALERMVHWSLVTGPHREHRRLCHLPAAAATLSPRQDAADRTAMVRRAAARGIGRNAGGDRGHAVRMGRTRCKRHDRADSHRVDEHDADSAPAHRRTGDRGADREWRLGPDGIWALVCGPAYRSIAVRLGDCAQPCACDLPRLERGTVVVGQEKTRSAHSSFSLREADGSR
jgi:hypothetical protein